MNSFGAHDTRIDWFFVRRIRSWSVSRWLWRRKRYFIESGMFSVAALWFLGVDFHLELDWWMIPIAYGIAVVVMIRFLVFLHRADEDIKEMK